MKIFELRTYTLHVGKLSAAMKIYEDLGWPALKKYKDNNWLGVVAACVSLEIIEKISDELKSLDMPFGFKANLWAVEEPLPVHRFNTAGYNEIGKNPNITLGKREEITGKVFCEFAKKIIKKGATILGGCCETDSSHIKELSKLK